MLQLSSSSVPYGVSCCHNLCLLLINCWHSISTGAFDIVSEFLPHISIILYRVYPTSHRFLRKIFRLSCITTITGTVAETILTMYLFGSLWDRWTIAFKITTPMIHLLFASAQLWGSYNFYRMYKKQERLIAEERALGDMEAGQKSEEAKNGRALNTSRGDSSRDGPSRDGSEIELTDPMKKSRTTWYRIGFFCSYFYSVALTGIAMHYRRRLFEP